MAARTSPTFRRRRLARRVRQLREQAGLTQERAAASLDMSTSALSRKETGEVATSVHEVRSMMDLYDIYDPDLVELARAAREKGWWRAYGIEDRGYVDLETEASTVRDFQVTNIPGLLQTEDYARALFATNRDMSQTVAENQVAARMVRCRRLADEEEPLHLLTVIDESALHREVGGRTVMARQLAHLVTQSVHPTVTLQVMPLRSSAHSAVNGGFTLLRFSEPEDPDVLFIEHVAGSLHIEKETSLNAARLVFDAMQAEALDTTASTELIDRLRRQL